MLPHVFWLRLPGPSSPSFTDPQPLIEKLCRGGGGQKGAWGPTPKKSETETVRSMRQGKL